MVSLPKNPMIPLDNNANTVNLEESGESLVKSMGGSFFDEPQIHSRVFVKHVISLQKMQENNTIYHKGVLYKKSTKSNKLLERFFFLTENGIYYSKVKFEKFIKNN